MDEIGDEQIERRQKTTKASVLFDFAEDVAFAVAIVVILFTFFIRIITVDGASMSPNYTDGDRLMVSAAFMNIQQGDVIIVSSTESVYGPIIKRVIAIGGQLVDFDHENGNVLVDGEVLDDSQYGVEPGITKISWSNYEALEFPAEVPEGCVFVLGDNRTLSKDSRYEDVGMIDKKNILGKAFFKIYPFRSLGKVV